VIRWVSVLEHCSKAPLRPPSLFALQLRLTVPLVSWQLRQSVVKRLVNFAKFCVLQ
jgi:hypothetical protein